MAFVSGVPNKLHIEECQFGASVSEEWSKKVAGSINFILDRFKVYEFGVDGAPLTNLTLPKVFTENMEYLDYNYYIQDFELFFENCGSLGSTIFSIQRYNTLTSTWVNLVAMDVPHTAPDLLRLTKADITNSYGVTITKSYLDTDIFTTDTKLRFVINSAAVDSQNITLSLKMRPTE